MLGYSFLYNNRGKLSILLTSGLFQVLNNPFNNLPFHPSQRRTLRLRPYLMSPVVRTILPKELSSGGPSSRPTSVVTRLPLYFETTSESIPEAVWVSLGTSTVRAILTGCNAVSPVHQCRGVVVTKVPLGPLLVPVLTDCVVQRNRPRRGFSDWYRS